ncbi:MAG TPA: transcription-repair coupling factor, partial [Solibacterales bacterium]|nr:transcription-repair coupling factor [Bryobacterales bacterium]
REPVELVGEYSVRGGILDVFPAEAQRPVRIEFFGDLVESMRRFDVETQRSVLKTEDVTILPLVETPRSRATLLELASHYDGHDIVPGETFPGWEFLAAAQRPREASVFSFVEAPLIVWDEPEQGRGAAERLWKRLEEAERASPVPPEKVYYRWEELAARTSGAGRLTLRELDLAGGTPAIAARPSMPFRGNMGVAVAEARNLVEAGNRVLFFAASTGELERLADILQEYRVPYQLAVDSAAGTPEYLAQRAYLSGAVASTYLVKGRVRRGAVFPEAGIAMIGSEDLFDTSDLVMRQPGPSASRMAAFAADLADLKPGDYVVHATHGVGRFLGLKELDQGDGKAEFMLLEYAGDAKLYVPLARMDLVQKYRGAGEAAPPLDRLGGATWAKTKSKVKAK